MRLCLNKIINLCFSCQLIWIRHMSNLHHCRNTPSRHSAKPSVFSPSRPAFRKSQPQTRNSPDGDSRRLISQVLRLMRSLKVIKFSKMEERRRVTASVVNLKMVVLVMAREWRSSRLRSRGGALFSSIVMGCIGIVRPLFPLNPLWTTLNF